MCAVDSLHIYDNFAIDQILAEKFNLGRIDLTEYAVFDVRDTQGSPSRKSSDADITHIDRTTHAWTGRVPSFGHTEVGGFKHRVVLVQENSRRPREEQDSKHSIVCLRSYVVASSLILVCPEYSA